MAAASSIDASLRNKISKSEVRVSWAGAWSVEQGAYSIGRAVAQELFPQLDLGSGIEILLEEGDLFVVDPMMLHAATPNTRRDLDDYRRYVLFSTFFDKRTTDHLLPPRGSSGPVRTISSIQAALNCIMH